VASDRLRGRGGDSRRGPRDARRRGGLRPAPVPAPTTGDDPTVSVELDSAAAAAAGVPASRGPADDDCR